MTPLHRPRRDHAIGPRAARTLPRILDVVPHRPPMLLLDEIVAWDGERVECRVVLRDDSPFVEGGRVASTLAIEYMAQCIAVFVGLEAHYRGSPIPLGYLVGAREISLPADGFRVGDALSVEASPIWGGETLGSFRCKVERMGEVVARGALNVYRGELRELARS
jgi:predicted hotdog family 3-hydroxylacyl-ACP dehydratase